MYLVYIIISKRSTVIDVNLINYNLKGFTYQTFESVKMYFACITSFAKKIKTMNNNSINIIVKTSQILSFYFGFNITFTERTM